VMALICLAFTARIDRVVRSSPEWRCSGRAEHSRAKRQRAREQKSRKAGSSLLSCSLLY
jgi:hypothetical protein